MKKIKLMCVSLMLIGLVPPGPVWANRGHHHGHHRHHHHGGSANYGWALGAGMLGYGIGSYFGSRNSYFGGYGAGYGYAPAYGFGPAVSPTVVVAPVVAAPVAPPPVYVQRQDVITAQPQPQPQASNYWHYCRNPEGYYPYVKSCPEGWMLVVPQ